MCGGANLGPHASVFEQGARHVGADIAGKNVVNPTGTVVVWHTQSFGGGLVCGWGGEGQ